MLQSRLVKVAFQDAFAARTSEQRLRFIWNVTGKKPLFNFAIPSANAVQEKPLLDVHLDK